MLSILSYSYNDYLIENNNMQSQSIKFKKLKKNSVESINYSKDCKVSNASIELMLDRFCNGNEIEFPFFKN